MQQHAVLVLNVGMKGLWVKFKVRQWIERWEREYKREREKVRGGKEDGRVVVIWNDASKWESEQSDWTNKLLYFFLFSKLIFPSTNMTFSLPWKCYVTMYKPTFFSFILIFHPYLLFIFFSLSLLPIFFLLLSLSPSLEIDFIFSFSFHLKWWIKLQTHLSCTSVFNYTLTVMRSDSYYKQEEWEAC